MDCPTASTTTDAQDEIEMVGYLETWLRLTDLPDCNQYLECHRAHLTASITKVILRWWIAAAPPALAEDWSSRLALVQSKCPLS